MFTWIAIATLADQKLHLLEGISDDQLILPYDEEPLVTSIDPKDRA